MTREKERGEGGRQRNVAYEHKQREEDKSPAQYIMRQRRAQYLLASKQDQKTRHSSVGIRVENKLTLGAFPFTRRYLRRDAAASGDGGSMFPNAYFACRLGKMDKFQQSDQISARLSHVDPNYPAAVRSAIFVL